MTVHGYTISYEYNSDNKSVTIFVTEEGCDKRVHSLTIENVIDRMAAYLQYIEYQDYLTGEGEYWFLDYMGVLSKPVNSFPVLTKRKV